MARIVSVCAVASGRGARSRRPREVVKPQPKYDRSAHSMCRPQPAGEAVDERDEHGVNGGGRLRSATDRPLRSHRTSSSSDLHGTRVAIVCEGMEMPAGSHAQHPNQHCLAELSDLGNGRDPRSTKLAGRDGSNSPKLFDWKRMEKCQLAIGGHYEQTVGLGHAAGHLCEELGSRHTDRDGEAYLIEHVASQSNGDLLRRARQPPKPSHIEEGLVDGQSLDHGSCLIEHLEERLARLGIGGHPRRHHHRVRTHPASPRSGHGRADPMRLSLVARRQHDPRSDNDRATP